MIIVTFLLERQNEEKEESVSVCVCLLERVCMNIKVCAYFLCFLQIWGLLPFTVPISRKLFLLFIRARRKLIS